MLDRRKLLSEIDSRYIPRIKVCEREAWRIETEDLYYRDLNRLLRSLNDGGVEKIELHNILGQRYIGTDLAAKMKITVQDNDHKSHT